MIRKEELRIRPFVLAVVIVLVLFMAKPAEAG
jgi:hypothetical protein